jgi:hypothetical protein
VQTGIQNKRSAFGLSKCFLEKKHTRFLKCALGFPHEAGIEEADVK